MVAICQMALHMTDSPISPHPSTNKYILSILVSFNMFMDSYVSVCPVKDFDLKYVKRGTRQQVPVESS
jgi:hypothetical protein